MKKILLILIFLSIIVSVFTIFTREEYAKKQAEVEFETLPYDEYVTFAEMAEVRSKLRSSNESSMNNGESQWEKYAKENVKAYEEYDQRREEYYRNQNLQKENDN